MNNRFLSIDKKAITEQDGQALLDQSYALTRPLGIATMFIRPEEFSPHWLEGKPSLVKSIIRPFDKNAKMRDELTDKINAFYEGGHLSHLSAEEQDEAMRRFHENVGTIADLVARTRLNPKSFNEMGAVAHNSDFSKPDEKSPETYKSPISSMIIMPMQETMETSFISEMIGEESQTAKDFSQSNSQIHFMALWHEIGHGLGAGEPQTEAISAMVTRKAFEDTEALGVFGDIRAYVAIMQHNQMPEDSRIIIPEREEYGWPMVEVNDYVRNLPADKIDKMTEGDIVNLRHQSFNHLGRNIQMVAEMMRDNNEEAWLLQDMKGLGEIAGDLADSPFLEDGEKQIARRFKLACERLRLGASAYREGNNFISSDLQQADKQDPLTFTPGAYIPE